MSPADMKAANEKALSMADTAKANADAKVETLEAKVEILEGRERRQVG